MNDTNEPAPEGGRACKHCGLPMLNDAHGLRKYCNPACRNRGYRVRNPEVLEGYMDRHREKLSDLHQGLDTREPLSIAAYKRGMLSAARHRAKKANLPFNITVDDIHIPDACPVLGIELQFNRGGRGHARDTSPSLDKVLPKLGYVRGNILVVSNRANTLKSNATVTELQALARFYSKHMIEDWMKP